MELSKDAALLYPSLIKIYITWELQGNYLGLSRIKKLASFPISSDPCMSERPKAAAALSVAATRTSGMDMRSVMQARFITSGYENSLVKTKQNPKWFASTHVRTIFLSLFLFVVFPNKLFVKHFQQKLTNSFAINIKSLIVHFFNKKNSVFEEWNCSCTSLSWQHMFKVNSK